MNISNKFTRSGSIKMMRIIFLPEAHLFSAAGWRTRSCCRPSAAAWCWSSSCASPRQLWTGWDQHQLCCKPQELFHLPQMPSHTSPWSSPMLSGTMWAGPVSWLPLVGTEIFKFQQLTYFIELMENFYHKSFLCTLINCL